MPGFEVRSTDSLLAPQVPFAAARNSGVSGPPQWGPFSQGWKARPLLRKDRFMLERLPQCNDLYQEMNRILSKKKMKKKKKEKSLHLFLWLGEEISCGFMISEDGMLKGENVELCASMCLCFYSQCITYRVNFA